MLFKLGVRKYLSLLIVLFIIFQLIPVTSIRDECFDSHATKSSLIFLKKVAQTDIPLLARLGRKSPFPSISVEFYYSIIENIYFTDTSESILFYLKIPIDYRKEIKQSIPHYFHGSKYKDMNLFI